MFNHNDIKFNKPEDASFQIQTKRNLLIFTKATDDNSHSSNMEVAITEYITF